MERLSRRAFSASIVGVLGGVLAACGRNTSEEAEPTVTRVAAQNAPPTNTPKPAEGAAGGGEASPPAQGGEQPAQGAGAPTTIDMAFVDLAFEPAELTIPANTDVTFTFTNQGALEHAFKIDEPLVESQTIPGGATDTLVVNLPPGTYEYYCPVPGHREAGMVGTLTVAEGAGGEAAPAQESPADEQPAPAGGATTVDMAFVDLAFEPAEVAIPGNMDVTFNFTNQGALEHAFKIDDPLVESKIVPGGGTDSLVVNLPAGTYEFYCPVPGHKEAGMVGTLTVQ